MSPAWRKFGFILTSLLFMNVSCIPQDPDAAECLSSIAEPRDSAIAVTPSLQGPEYIARRNAELQKWKDDMDRDCCRIPHSAIIRKITQAEWQALERAREAEDLRQETALSKLLKTKLVSFALEDLILQDFVLSIRDNHEVKIVTSKLVAEEFGEELVTASCQGLNLGDAIKLVVGQYDLTYEIRNKTIHVIKSPESSSSSNPLSSKDGLTNENK